MVNIPVIGAVKVEYTITGGATFAIFVDTATPTKWEIGLKTVNGVTDTLQSVCVTYTEGVPFASIPADAATSTQHQATHYPRKLEDGGTENWWPSDAAFTFAGKTKMVCVVTDGVVQGEVVDGPFPKAPVVALTPTPKFLWKPAEPNQSCDDACTASGLTCQASGWVGQTMADCLAVLKGFGYTLDAASTQGDTGGPSGCRGNTSGVWFHNADGIPATTCEATNYLNRACPCQ